MLLHKEVLYEYKTLFDDEVIKIMVYNNETIIAEKYEAIIRRNIDNTRMKDYYDLYMFTNLKWNVIDKKVLKEAIINTARKRNTLHFINDSKLYINLIEDDDKLKKLWNNYRTNYEYAFNISFLDTVLAIKKVNSLF